MKYIELPEGKPCIRIVNENLRLVEENKPLKYPLRFLNSSCEFRKRYKILWDLKHEKEIKSEEEERKREYNNKPEAKAKRKEYQKKPEVKARKKEYWKENKNKPEVKAKKREYYLKNKENYKKRYLKNKGKKNET